MRAFLGFIVSCALTVTCYAISATFSWSDIIGSKFMPVNAVRLAGVSSYGAITPCHVFLVGNRFEVVGSDTRRAESARPTGTEMVKFEPVRNTSNKVFISPYMSPSYSSRPPFPISKYSIVFICDISCPLPATRFQRLMFGNHREKSDDGIWSTSASFVVTRPQRDSEDNGFLTARRTVSPRWGRTQDFPAYLASFANRNRASNDRQESVLTANCFNNDSAHNNSKQDAPRSRYQAARRAGEPCGSCFVEGADIRLEDVDHSTTYRKVKVTA